MWTADGVNVAIGKPCTSSPIYNTGMTCSLALQGVYRAENFPNMYHSAGLGAFMQVDLGGNFNIVRVDYYNRGDGEYQRAVGAKVELIDSNGAVLASQTITTAGTSSSLTFANVTPGPSISTTTTTTASAMTGLFCDFWY